LTSVSAWNCFSHNTCLVSLPIIHNNEHSQLPVERKTIFSNQIHKWASMSYPFSEPPTKLTDFRRYHFLMFWICSTHASTEPIK
jgi:hypothetical protein